MQILLNLSPSGMLNGICWPSDRITLSTLIGLKAGNKITYLLIDAVIDIIHIAVEGMDLKRCS